MSSSGSVKKQALWYPHTCTAYYRLALPLRDGRLTPAGIPSMVKSRFDPARCYPSSCLRKVQLKMSDESGFVVVVP